MACNGDRYVTMYCDDCGEPRQVRITCGDRACPSCRELVYKRQMMKYKPLLKIVESKRCVLVTVTRKIKPGIGAAGLQERVEETRQAFKKLIRLNCFTGIQGGFYSIEIKWSDKVGGWNVHIHALCELSKGGVRRIWKIRNRGKGRDEYKADIYHRQGNLTVQILSEEWRRLTGDSYFVDIMPINDRYGGAKGGLAYILKYLTKPVEIGGRTFEYNLALKHKVKENAKRKDGKPPKAQGYRMIHAFGTWYPNSKEYRFRDCEKAQKWPLTCEHCSNTRWFSEYDMRWMMLEPTYMRWVDPITREEARAGPVEVVAQIVQERLFGF